MSNSNLQKNCIKFCKSEGIFHISTRGSKAPTKYPNLVVCVNGAFVAFIFEETLEQRLQIKKLLACGGRLYRPHTLGEFVATIRQLQEEIKNERTSLHTESK